MWRRGGSALSPGGWSGAEGLPVGHRGSLQVPSSCVRPGAGCSLEEKVGRCLPRLIATAGQPWCTPVWGLGHALEPPVLACTA